VRVSLREGRKKDKRISCSSTGRGTRWGALVELPVIAPSKRVDKTAKGSVEGSLKEKQALKVATGCPERVHVPEEV